MPCNAAELAERLSRVATDAMHQADGPGQAAAEIADSAEAAAAAASRAAERARAAASEGEDTPPSRLDGA